MRGHNEHGDEYTAVPINGVMTVVHADGGRWFPGDEAQREIGKSSRPAHTAVLICDQSPTRGWWSS